ncbi:radical SAM/SPASM domain-containing protein [Anaerocolumna xylanovorans]|uniref:Radical SAM additional 4Fe4S-binding SPASM domain-containing protein n=1 Tax=Anaerocolumna xylanovorans DSM 12503 TaxID=1121345 RepID=A0A1M7Y9A5_9FIRM|nr:radical SAM protein [Anaerocolumna xylanovorans]SHO49108.1 radical SAM additional 4Fe4S-binding SPASM domain-containing protein [Anaerocolumna xylanovorans DSM 12503]
MQNNILPKFIKVENRNKVALIDPENAVCLGVSKRTSDNLDDILIQKRLFPIWQEQVDLQKRIHSNRERINTIYLMVTRQCNMNCDFCAINANQNMDLSKEFTADSIKNYVVPFLKECTPHKLIITGGEPLIKQDLLKIIEMVKNSVKCHIALQSNGLEIKKEFVHGIKNNIDEIDFSVAHMIGNDKLEQKLIQNIELCQQNGIEIALSFVYDGTNEQKLLTAIDYAAKYNTQFLLTNTVPVGRAKENGNIISVNNQIDLFTNVAKYILEKKYEDKLVAEIFFAPVQIRKGCGGYGKIMSIFPEGNIYMCQSLENDEFKIGNILEDSSQELLEKLNSKLELPMIKQTFCVDNKNICCSCIYRYLCGGKCAVSDDDSDPKCLLVKAFIDYSLFYYEPKENVRYNLSSYINHLQSLKG